MKAHKTRLFVLSAVSTTMLICAVSLYGDKTGPCTPPWANDTMVTASNISLGTCTDDAVNYYVALDMTITGNISQSGDEDCCGGKAIADVVNANITGMEWDLNSGQTITGGPHASFTMPGTTSGNPAEEGEDVDLYIEDAGPTTSIPDAYKDPPGTMVEWDWWPINVVAPSYATSEYTDNVGCTCTGVAKAYNTLVGYTDATGEEESSTCSVDWSSITITENGSQMISDGCHMGNIFGSLISTSGGSSNQIPVNSFGLTTGTLQDVPNDCTCNPISANYEDSFAPCSTIDETFWYSEGKLDDGTTYPLETFQYVAHIPSSSAGLAGSAISRTP